MSSCIQRKWQERFIVYIKQQIDRDGYLKIFQGEQEKRPKNICGDLKKRDEKIKNRKEKVKTNFCLPQTQK